MVIIEYKDWKKNQPLKVARYTGGCVYNGKTYVLDKASKDLIDTDWYMLYLEYGRDKVKSLVDGGVTSPKEAKAIIMQNIRDNAYMSLSNINL